ncbi:MAG: endonuclease [Candidatus Tenebribacter burtonii]|jgi:endonuclease I|nr:endonuclease [Candidatus Tenebribacter burtonii]
MKINIIFILVILVFSSILYSQTEIGQGLSEEELLNYILQNFKTSTTLGYNTCRDIMYSEIDLKPGNQLSGIYSGFTITMDLSQDPSTYAYNNGINCEHSWPQSMGADVEPQKSDMHHLYPCRTGVNSSRGNDPFGEIPDQNADRWYRLDETFYTIPTQNIDEYSEKENDDPDFFEPRESVKGDIARSMFYFFAMYEPAANTTFWNTQKETLQDWHEYDPVDATELDRIWAIASYQENKPNPFVIDSTLSRRIWFFEDSIVAPQELAITKENNNIILSWTSVLTAVSYNIYGSIDPVDGFYYLLSTPNTTISYPISESKFFFKVTAVK